jgi:hypothetical protein
MIGTIIIDVTTNTDWKSDKTTPGIEWVAACTLRRTKCAGQVLRVFVGRLQLLGGSFASRSLLVPVALLYFLSAFLELLESLVPARGHLRTKERPSHKLSLFSKLRTHTLHSVNMRSLPHEFS